MSGETVKSFDPDGTLPFGLTFDGKYLWLCDYGTDLIYQLDLDGKTVKSFDPDGATPAGLAFDGKYLWLYVSTTGLIYQLNR